MTEETPEEELKNEPETPVIEKEEPKEEEEEKEKYSRKVQKSINRYTRKATEADQRAEQLQREVDELRKASVIKNEPKEDDYSDFDTYKNDKDKYTKQNEDRIRGEERQRLQKENYDNYQRQREDDSIEAYNENRPKAIKEFKDYETSEFKVNKAIQEFNQMGYSTIGIRTAILQSPKHGGAIMNYLGTHSAELDKIAQLPQMDQAIALGRIEERVQAKALKTVSTAPEPAEGTRGGAQTTQADSSLSYFDWNRKRNGIT